MFRPRCHRAPARRGVILVVVLALLTLFAMIGLAFVLYADAAATSSRLRREAESAGRADAEPELLLAHFLGQLIYDVPDDEAGVASAMRGHSLARSMYGFSGYDDTPFNGTGRLHTGPGSYANPFGLDDYYLVNYRWFPADDFLRDPERLGFRTDLSQARGPFAGGFNAPYTYPDLNNLYLAAVNADGKVLLPSFHRPWLFGSNDPTTNPNWKNAAGKYLLLRPRPIDMGPGFPYPEDAGGDVKNLIGGPGGNDSVWLDLDFPVLSTPDGRKYKPLFAPLIVDLDGRVNLNVHGNVRGKGPTHVSNQGWGPWEVNLGRVLTKGNEWPNLFEGSAKPPALGRYGGIPWAGQDGTPALPGARAPAIRRPHFYAQVDYDGGNEATGLPTSPFRLPGFGGSPFSCFPEYRPDSGWGNGWEDERTDHPLLYNVFRPAGDDRRFPISDLEALLRHGDTGAEALTSQLARLCPNNFADARTRRLVTTHSFDRDQPGVLPWVYRDPNNPPLPYQVPASDPEQCPAGPPIPFPALALRKLNAKNGEFADDWRADEAILGRINLNRRLMPYPLPSPQTPTTYNARFDVAAADQFQQAQRDRQKLADDVYRRLLAVTGVASPAKPAAPTDAELMPLRWLAQLAVNIVDFIDEDDVSTPFNFYTADDAGTPDFDVGALTDKDPELPRYWVFGTELPHLVVNEVLAEYRELPLGAPITRYEAKVWVELHNPFLTPPSGAHLQPQGGFPVPLRVEALPGESLAHKPDAYAPYQIVVTNRLRPRLGNNDNVLGAPDKVPLSSQTEVADFKAVRTIGGAPLPAPAVAAQGFFLLGPPDTDAHSSITTPPVPPETPLLHSANLQLIIDPAQWTEGVTVLLRRLANPHLPLDSRPTVKDKNGSPRLNPWYNPYVTVDYLDRVPLRNELGKALYASWGKLQPYAADFSQMDNQAAEGLVTQHTFGRPNNPLPTSGHYDWLVHLDRPLISPMELLQVAGCPPHALTHRFMDGSGRFNHRAPWFDQTRRIYRVLEFLETKDRAAGVGVGGRIPGRVNLNTVWDPETFQALCDPQAANHFTMADVDAVYQRLLRLRTPGGAPGPADRPFLGLATGFTAANGPQYPAGIGIEDTLLRSFNGGARRLFQPAVPRSAPPDDPARHPYLRDELLTKLFNNVTVRSNVFAVWLTVGFFEVTDDTTQPVKLGAEIGRSEGRHVRHRTFAIVDRSRLMNNPGPATRFDPRLDVGVVPHFSIID